MNIICRFLGHKYLYNFASLPSKRICQRCKQRQHIKYDGFLPHLWVDGMEETRTDDELIKKWVHLPE